MLRFHIHDNTSGKSYDVYKRFVCYHSPVFVKAFSGQNREVLYNYKTHLPTPLIYWQGGYIHRTYSVAEILGLLARN
jgi:hypothetical protein